MGNFFSEEGSNQTAKVIAGGAKQITDDDIITVQGRYLVRKDGSRFFIKVRRESNPFHLDTLQLFLHLLF